jgi:hypothetical protein
MSTLLLTDVRARAAAALAPATDDDPNVYADLPDAVHPPALFLDWVDPWLEPQTVAGNGWWNARLDVVCIAARVQPGPGVTTLEELVTFAIARLKDDAYPWPAATLQAPRVFTIAGVPYLGARVSYRLPVTV